MREKRTNKIQYANCFLKKTYCNSACRYFDDATAIHYIQPPVSSLKYFIEIISHLSLYKSNIAKKKSAMELN